MLWHVVIDELKYFSIIINWLLLKKKAFIFYENIFNKYYIRLRIEGQKSIQYQLLLFHFLDFYFVVQARQNIYSKNHASWKY